LGPFPWIHSDNLCRNNNFWNNKKDYGELTLMILIDMEEKEKGIEAKVEAGAGKEEDQEAGVQRKEAGRIKEGRRDED